MISPGALWRRPLPVCAFISFSICPPSKADHWLGGFYWRCFQFLELGRGVTSDSASPGKSLSASLARPSCSSLFHGSAAVASYRRSVFHLGFWEPHRAARYPASLCLSSLAPLGGAQPCHMEESQSRAPGEHTDADPVPNPAGDARAPDCRL